MDTVSVSSTSGDCFIAPTHTGKITITSADGYDGKLDLMAVEHFHFGGDTEFNNIGIIANEVVLSAGNHTVTMGEGLEMSSPSAEIYRGGHTYCGAKIHLAAYAPCETANITCEAAGGRLNVYSGEYWSVSAWYGENVTITGGETFISFDTQTEKEKIWVRYLCPGLYGMTIDSTLSCAGSEVTLLIESGVNTAELYRFTKNHFSGSMTVNWLLKDSAQGNATAFIAKDFYPTNEAECRLNVFVEQTNIAAKSCAQLLVHGMADMYGGDNSGKAELSCYCDMKETHKIEPQSDGRLICFYCGFEQCRHLYTTETLCEPATCTSQAYYKLTCDDLCGEVSYYYKGEYDPTNHSTTLRRMVGMTDAQSAEVYCSACNGYISSYNVNDDTVYVSNYDDFYTVMNEAAMRASVFGTAKMVLDISVGVPASYNTPYYDGMITITGKPLWFKESPRRFYMNGDVIFENITFRTNSSTAGMVICAQNHKLVMGEGIVMGNVGTIPTEEGFSDCNCVKMYIVGGFEGVNGNTMNTDITIRSGDYWYVGGWNYNASTNDGVGRITIGKTNPNDKLQVFYLCPFSRGNGFITKEAESTIIVDGDLYVKRFYLTTLNDATTGINYITNIVLKGDITGYNEEIPDLPFDLRGCPVPYPDTVVNVYTDNRVATAVEDSYVFFGHPDGAYSRDPSLTRLGASVRNYSYTDYCEDNLGGHLDSDIDTLCDKCGYAMS